VTEDKAACCFARGFYTAIGRGEYTGAVTIGEAYDAAAALFVERGFRCGDPEPHLARGVRRPPVHGKHMLVRSSDYL
jgi:hypothetical protein